VTANTPLGAHVLIAEEPGSASRLGLDLKHLAASWVLADQLDDWMVLLLQVLVHLLDAAELPWRVRHAAAPVSADQCRLSPDLPVCKRDAGYTEA